MKWNADYNHSNEPVHQMAFLLALAGRPDLTQKWSRRVCEHAYATGAAGLAGNDRGSAPNRHSVCLGA
ncbi:glycoside hydrolase domain-containing protein [Kutzneria sp. 744]|uniref:glycoside hydrolase domain-containing protein n=1 Tax=Kutzneria sp. (strain 744) TaxID=345341 RepID=UPI0004BBC2AA|nr:glycoside hydrolase domain-containing protein [Kutzneria sp. 744]